MDPKKLPYIIERAVKDELIEQGERLQRGELPDRDAEALRTSTDPEARVVYELYRPLTDIEKQRLRRPARKGVPAGLAAAVASVAAAAVVLLVAARPLAPEPATAIVASGAAELDQGHHVLGAAATSAVPVVDIGGCTTLLLAARERSARLPSDEQAMAFWQRGDTIVRWPARLRYTEASGLLTGQELCTRLPVEGLSEGEWQLAIVYGRELPSEAQARSALRGAWIPFWARWSITRTPVQLRRVNP